MPEGLPESACEAEEEGHASAYRAEGTCRDVRVRGWARRGEEEESGEEAASLTGPIESDAGSVIAHQTLPHDSQMNQRISLPRCCWLEMSVPEQSGHKTGAILQGYSTARI
jgi:hypothetical protein